MIKALWGISDLRLWLVILPFVRVREMYLVVLASGVGIPIAIMGCPVRCFSATHAPTIVWSGCACAVTVG
jgi:hypothetical protein